MLTDGERSKALESLHRSREILLEAVSGLSDAQARWKPAADRWSALELVEHLTVADDGLIDLIQRSLESPPRVETEEERRTRQKRIRETPAPRGANRAPKAFQPNGRFGTLEEARQNFLAARERTIGFAETTPADLRRHFAPHPLYGSLDCYQWLVGCAHHAETHAEHIRELRGTEGFPRE